MKKTELNFDLKQLRSFLAIISEKSFTKASRKLKIGQSTISHQINSLEEMLGARLLDRSGKVLSVTGDGKRFKDFCEKHLDDVEKLKSELNSSVPGTAVRVSASSIPSTYILPKLIAGIYKENPEFYYQVEIVNSREAIELVRDGSVEAGVVGKKIQFPGLKYIHCFSDEILLIGPAGSSSRIKTEEIKILPMINRESGSGTRDAYEKALNDRGIIPSLLNIVYECNSSEAVKQSVIAGMGYSFISSLAISDEKDSNRFSVIKIPGIKIKRDFYIVYFSRKSMPAQLEVFINSINKLHQ
jgi:DNA-binding transcriptional LysR family regulator